MVFLTAVLALACLTLGLWVWSLRSAMREIEEGMDFRLKNDTNTLLTVSSRDRSVRALAKALNVQLRALREERRRLQNGDRELREAVTNISHDLRTPLTALCGYLDLLEAEALPPAAERYLSTAQERAGALRSLTEELFRYSVIVSTADELHPEPVSLGGLLQESLAGLYAAFARRGITPKVELPEEPVLRKLDRAALCRIYSNLLGNALKYSDGDLTVALSPEGRLVFANAARALDAVQTERLFNRFYTVDSARNATGLGLSIAKLLTEKMGGRISAEYRDGSLYVTLEFYM